MQHLDMGGRAGLLRTVLEAQETRGLTRSDDISRLLPAGAARVTAQPAEFTKSRNSCPSCSGDQ